MIIIPMRKYGTILNSRQFGREAFLSAINIIDTNNDSDLSLDFSGVEILTPSFSDEFVAKLQDRYSGRVKIEKITSGAVAETLHETGILEKA